MERLVRDADIHVLIRGAVGGGANTRSASTGDSCKHSGSVNV